MKTITYTEFKADLMSQGVATRLDLAFVCPICGTVQSARDLIAAGAGDDFEKVERYIGFSCVGRWTGAGSPMKDSGKACNWTLGGLLQTHKLEVITEDGEKIPHFEIATPEQAQEHAARHGVEVQ